MPLAHSSRYFATYGGNSCTSFSGKPALTCVPVKIQSALVHAFEFQKSIKRIFGRDHRGFLFHFPVPASVFVKLFAHVDMVVILLAANWHTLTKNARPACHLWRGLALLCAKLGFAAWRYAKIWGNGTVGERQRHEKPPSIQALDIFLIFVVIKTRKYVTYDIHDSGVKRIAKYPLRYPGGKTRAVWFIVDTYSQNLSDPRLSVVILSNLNWQAEERESFVTITLSRLSFFGRSC
ncbi:MAG: hypothetical protein LBL45_00920 [Treponema sp.]|jgi:hypothetical protein|nr:hypothetical protein [Treponema sp.]